MNDIEGKVFGNSDLRLHILKFILEIINQNDLLENTKETGNYLYTQLYEFQKP